MSKILLVAPLCSDIAYLYYSAGTDSVLHDWLPPIIKANRRDWKAWIEVEKCTRDEIIGRLLRKEFVRPDLTPYFIHGSSFGSVLLNKNKVPIDILEQRIMDVTCNNGLLTVTARAKLKPYAEPSGIDKVTYCRQYVVGNDYVEISLYDLRFRAETDNIYTVYIAESYTNHRPLIRKLGKTDGLTIAVSRYGVVAYHISFGLVAHCCDLDDQVLSALTSVESNRYMRVVHDNERIATALHLSDAVARIVAELPGKSIVNLLLGKQFPEMDTLLDIITSTGGIEDKWLIEHLPYPTHVKQHALTKLTVRWASE